MVSYLEKTWIRFIILCILTFAFGYGEKAIPYYVKAFNPDLKLHGNILQFESHCDLKGDDAFCAKRYLIPQRVLEGERKVGLGIILSATKIYCDREPKKYLTYDDPKLPSRLFNLMNIYQVADLTVLDCKHGLVVEAWARNGGKRTGYQMGPLVTGTGEGVDLIKNLVEIFTIQIFTWFGLIVFVIFVILEKARESIGPSKFESPFLYGLPAWIILLFSMSGLLQGLFPFTGSLIGNRLVAGASLIAHALPLVKILSINRLTMAVVSSFFLVGITTSVWIYIFWSGFWLLSLLFLYHGSVKRNADFILLGVVSLLTILKIMNFRVMPSGRSSIFLVCCLILIHFSITLREILRSGEAFVKLKEVMKLKNKTDEILSQYKRQISIQERERRLAHDLQSPISVLEVVKNADIYKEDTLNLFTSSLERLKGITFELLEKDSCRAPLSLEVLLKKISLEKEVVYGGILTSNYRSTSDLFIHAEQVVPLERCFSNLIANSFEAYPDGKNKRVEISSELKAGYLKIEIINQAPRMAAESLKKLNSGIQFTTKTKGHGLGAVNSKDIIEALGGAVVYECDSLNKVIVSMPLSFFKIPMINS